MDCMPNSAFWDALDWLYRHSKIIIDRPKGTAHPRYSSFIYSLDYGYLENTSSMDGDGIDVYVGSQKDRKIDAILCTVDTLKKDSEIKLLVGCTTEEKELVYQMHNDTASMKGILISR